MIDKEEMVQLLVSKGWNPVTNDWPHNVLSVKDEMGCVVHMYDGVPSVVVYDDLARERSIARLAGDEFHLLTPIEAMMAIHMEKP